MSTELNDTGIMWALVGAVSELEWRLGSGVGSEEMATE